MGTLDTLKVEVHPSDINGKGVFAVQDLAQGEVILTIDDTRVVDDEHPLRPKVGENPDHCGSFGFRRVNAHTSPLDCHPERSEGSRSPPTRFLTVFGMTNSLPPGEIPETHHCDYLPDGTLVLMQEPERYINHSCEPNVFVYSVHYHRFLLAMRPIEAGEELVYDYAINAVDGDVWECRCGAGRCRGRHKCDVFALPRRRQLKYLPFLDPWFATVHGDHVLALLKTS